MKRRRISRGFWIALVVVLFLVLSVVGLQVLEESYSPYPIFTPKSHIREFETRMIVLHHVAKGLSYYQRENKGQFPEPTKLPGVFGKFVGVPYDEISAYVNLAHSYNDGKLMLGNLDGIVCPMDAWGNPVLFFRKPDTNPGIDADTIAARSPGGGKTSMPVVASAGPNGEWERGRGDDILNQVSSDPHKQR